MDPEQARTISIVRELVCGKQLTLPNGYTLAMSKDMTIGFIMGCQDYIVGSMTLAQLHALLTKFDIGPVIPEVN